MNAQTGTTKLRRESLVEQLASELLTLIVDQGLDEGDSLPSTSELVARFGVSVIVVREAIAILVGRGIVRRQQGREPTVRRPGAEVLESLFRVRASQDGISSFEIEQCRSALEVQAVALAATAANENHRRDVLEPLLENMNAARGHDELARADQAFHEGIVALSGNRALGLIVDALRTAMRAEVNLHWDRWFASVEDGSPTPAIAHHEAIARAVIRGDRDGSVRAMADHFLHWDEWTDLGQLQQLKLES